MQGKNLPIVICDYRERASGIPEKLRRSGVLSVQEEKLGVGDYILPSIIVERKTWSDFAQSLYDGRLFRQLFAMKRTGRRVLLILEQQKYEANWLSQNALRAALLTISGRMQIPIWWSYHTNETTEALIYLALARQKSPALPIHRFLPQAQPRVDELSVLAAISGVGEQRAKLLLECFGSIAKICSANKAELMQVNGIGEVQAKKIFEILHA